MKNHDGDHRCAWEGDNFSSVTSQGTISQKKKGLSKNYFIKND